MPFAHLHTQWPGDRNDPNDPALLQFLASSGPFGADAADRQALEQKRLVELVDKIGPAFVVSNSLGGPAGFLLADARPDLVVALMQVEPIGPAFATMFGPDTLQWGVAAVPMTFDPPASSLSELDLVEHEPAAPGGPPLVLQAEPPRKLANLATVRIAVVSGEASIFRFTDGLVIEFLRPGRVRCRAHRSRRARGPRQQSRLDVRTQQRRSARGRHRLDVKQLG